ncbi:hypothetical protein Tco_1063088 [Tanacetum coccineum]
MCWLCISQWLGMNEEELLDHFGSYNAVLKMEVLELGVSLSKALSNMTDSYYVSQGMRSYRKAPKSDMARAHKSVYPSLLSRPRRKEQDGSVFGTENVPITPFTSDMLAARDGIVTGTLVVALRYIRMDQIMSLDLKVMNVKLLYYETFCALPYERNSLCKYVLHNKKRVNEAIFFVGNSQLAMMYVCNKASKHELELPEELSRVHNTFHVSNLKKCHADEPLAVPLDGLHFDDKLQFVEEPIEITDREVKRLKRSRIPLVKVRWNSKRGPEFTWEREDQFRKKYPHLFTKTAPSSSVV